MNLIYIHGLDSDANSTKGRLLEDYCHKHHSDINVYRPNLNSAPEQVFEQLVKLVTELNKGAKTSGSPLFEEFNIRAISSSVCLTVNFSFITLFKSFICSCVSVILRSPLACLSDILLFT